MPDPSVDFSWTAWHGHPSVVIGLLVVTGAYLVWVGPLRRRLGVVEAVGAGRVTMFLSGILVLFVALVSPLHELGDGYLFSAHMVQHLLLTLVVPPLLLLGTPGWLLRPLLLSPKVYRAARLVTLPVIAFILFNTVFVIWHVPALYDLALRERGIHILEHLMFIGAGVIVWWPILSPLPELPRASYMMQMLYLFVQPTVPSVLGAMITFSGKVLYEWYAEAPRLWDISPHTDQEIGGVIMWVPGGLAFLIVLIVVFLVWAAQEASDVEQPGGVESRS